MLSTNGSPNAEEIRIPLSDIIHLAYAPYRLATKLEHPAGLMSSDKKMSALSINFRLVASTQNLTFTRWIARRFPANPYSTFSGLRAIILDHKTLNYRVVTCAGTHKVADVLNDFLFLMRLKTAQEFALRRFVERHLAAKPHIFVGHSLGGYLAMCGAKLFQANYITVNPGYGPNLDMGVARGIHILSEHDCIAGVVRKRLPGPTRIISGTGRTHSPQLAHIDAYVSLCPELSRHPELYFGDPTSSIGGSSDGSTASSRAPTGTVVTT